MTKERPRVITFHDRGNKYFWDKASGTVTDIHGRIAAQNCHNLQTARDKVGRLK